jgi:hypothetical protein
MSARNRTRKAVELTVPFGLFCHSILILWYTLHGHDQTDVGDMCSHGGLLVVHRERPVSCHIASGGRSEASSGLP